jgi:transcriptional regulator with XRE-family HTH domain
MTSPWPDPPESIGALLARVRTAAGKSQLRLAELLCAASGTPTVTRHEVSRWEREQRLPSAYWLGWLAVVLDTPLDDLERATAMARRRRAARDREPSNDNWLVLTPRAVWRRRPRVVPLRERLGAPGAGPQVQAECG